MSRNNENLLTVPPSIELLFNNEKLDLMKVLCLMYAFSRQSNKRRKIGEILFYYSLVNFNLLRLFEENEVSHNGSVPSPNLYFRFQKKINSIILNMSNLEFVTVHGDISKKLDDITVQLRPKGKAFFEEQSSGFFESLQKKYTATFEEVAFSASNLKVLKGMQQWGK